MWTSGKPGRTPQYNQLHPAKTHIAGKSLFPKCHIGWNKAGSNVIPISGSNRHLATVISMGKRGSKLCMNCFGRNEGADSPDPPLKPAPKQATDDRETPATEDKLALSQQGIQLALLSEEDQRFVSHINNTLDAFFGMIRAPVTSDPELNLISNKGNLIVHSKDTPRGFLLRSEWLMEFEPSEFIQFLGDVELRPNWDKKMESVTQVKSILSEYGVYYQKYKKIMLLAQRDVLYVSKTFQLGTAWVDICSSIELPEFPPDQNDTVRMRLFLGGYYAEPLAVPVGALKTKVTCVSECDFGGAVPRAIVKKVSAITIPSYVKEVEDALRAHLGR